MLHEKWRWEGGRRGQESTSSAQVVMRRGQKVY